MSHDRRLPRPFLVVAAMVAAACAGDPVTAPTPSLVETPQAAASGLLQTRALVGSYQLSFVNSSLQPVTTLSVCSQSSCEELILQAHVDDGAGNPAQGGSATFQYCSYKGLPPNDITRADEAPSSACADGSANWQNLGSAPVTASGNAYLNFGVVQLPRTVGFRFRYTSQHSGIASGTSAPQDFTWTAA